jgi:hypothetical protein
VPPIGYICRQALQDRWLRIHSLPESKRYPEDEAEFRELLQRHNEVATAVLGEGSQCVLFAVSYDEQPGPADMSDLPCVDGSAVLQVPQLSFRPSDELVPLWARVAAIVMSWRRGALDPLLREVAEDRTRVIVANLGLGTAYAPYDGGADLILGSAEAVGPAKAAWRPWLSERADGL